MKPKIVVSIKPYAGIGLPNAGKSSSSGKSGKCGKSSGGGSSKSHS